MTKGGKLNDKLFSSLKEITHTYGYMCYYDDEGAQFVLDMIIDCLSKYKITEIQGE